MKLFFLCLSMFVVPQTQSLTLNSPQSFYSKNLSCDNVPVLNKKIIAFVNSKINKKVGRGECWDLAAEALNSVEATWDHDFGFGTKVDIKKDCIYPGDIIQFTNVTVEYQEGNRTFSEVMTQHTAIIYEVKSPGNYIMADQNTTAHGKKVGLNALNLKNILTGTYQAYRPTQ